MEMSEAIELAIVVLTSSAWLVELNKGHPKYNVLKIEGKKYRQAAKKLKTIKYTN